MSVTSTMEVSSAYEGYQADFTRLQDGLNAAGTPPSVKLLRQKAMERFSRLGFPTTRMEDWRFTNVAPIANRPYALGALTEVTADEIARFLIPELPGALLVFVNGRFSASLSDTDALPSGVEVQSLSDALATGLDTVEPYLVRLESEGEQPFSSLNTAFLQDGAVIRVGDGVVLRDPVHVLFVSTAPGEAVVTHPRVLLLAGDNSQVSVIESYAGLRDAGYFTNAVTQIDAGAGSVVNHCKILRESLQSYHVAGVHARLARSAVVTSNSITLGGALVRNDIGVVLDGEGAECTLNGLYLAGWKQHIDNHTTIDHASPHCASHELYKGILDGDGRAVFNGKIIVRQDAQKTDAKQSNKALLLSERAQVNTKPQLEIFADDVKCTHGATVGQLDEDALFYLRARGLGREEARRILIQAFATDVLNRIRHKPIQVELGRTLLDRLPSISAGETA